MLYNSILRFYNFFFSYPTPSNLTNVWNFGVLAVVFFSLQFISGAFLSMYYIPHELYSYSFIEFIMRDCFFGYYVRYIHSNGASFFFFVVYMHLFRSLYYFSYIQPKLLSWNVGVVLFITMIITAFSGYVLPWGQMSYWAATVITNLLTVIPFFGIEVVTSIWGSYGVTTITLNRFYTLHFFLPFAIIFFMGAHFIFLHMIGSSNNLLIESKDDKVPFNPYYTLKDLLVIIITLSIFFFIVWYTPNSLSHTDNYIPANPLVTPSHIVPEWYFSPFYAILRSVPHKTAGVILMASSLLILFVFPFFIKIWYKEDIWSATSFNLNTYEGAWKRNIISKRYSPFQQKILFWVFIVDFIGLGYIGMMPVEKPYQTIGLIFTTIYFSYFMSSFYLHSIHYWMAIIVDNDEITGWSIHFKTLIYTIITTTKKYMERNFSEDNFGYEDVDKKKQKQVQDDIDALTDKVDVHLKFIYDPEAVSKYTKSAPAKDFMKDINYAINDKGAWFTKNSK